MYSFVRGARLFVKGARDPDDPDNLPDPGDQIRPDRDPYHRLPAAVYQGEKDRTNVKSQMASASQESREVFRTAHNRSGLRTVHTSRVVRKTTTLTRGELKTSATTQNNHVLVPAIEIPRKKTVSTQLRSQAREYGTQTATTENHMEHSSSFHRSDIHDTEEQTTKRVHRITKEGSSSATNTDDIRKKMRISDIITHQTDERITAKEALLRWAQRTTDKYPGVRVGDFTSSWRDGLAFNAIIHRNRPDLVDYRTCLKRNARDNLDSAFTVAERELNVTKLLDPEDVDTPEPDEKSLITYISSLYDVFPRPPSHNPFATDDEKARKVEEYKDLASSLFTWMREALSLLQDRNFPSTLVEMKSLLADCTRFKVEDVPPRLHDKQRLTHWYREIQKIFGGSMDIHDELHIDSIERYWNRTMTAHQDRDQAIHDEIARLEKLQRLAEKVHRETKQCDGKLDDIERHISEEEKKLQRLLSTDSKHNCDQIESDLRHVEESLKSMARDVQTLRDGRYPQASDLHRRVQQLHERFLNLRMHFQSRLLSVLAARSLKVEERKVKPRPLSLEKLIETNKSFKFLQECYEWVQNKLKYLEEAEYGSDLPTAQSLLEQHHTEHRLIDQFQKNVDQCSLQKTQFRGEELELYCKLLSKLEKNYSELLILSNKRMSDLDTLVDFLQAATNELIWMNEKEEVEVGRDWSSNSLNLLDVEQYEKSFTVELEKREVQFSSVQDRGESLVLQKHAASKCIEAYLAAMQTQWSWLLQLISCLDVHIKHASVYHQFFNEAKECQQWLKRIEDRLNTTYSRQSFSIDEGERLMKEMQELRDDLSHYSNVVSSLIERSQDVAPLKQRRQPLPRPLRVTAVCAYKHHSMSVAKDEHCWLHDNSQRTKWRIINSSGLEGMVPGVCFLIPPPNPEALELAESLKKHFEVIVNLWTLKQRKLRQNMIFATIKIIKSWDITKFRSIEPNQRESIIKALNEDTQKLLNEGSSDDPALKRLQEEIAYCNKLFADLQRMLDQDEIDRVNKSQARKFNDLANSVQNNLTERERLLKTRTQAPIPRSRHLVDELMREHKEFESDLQTMEPKVAEVREAFRELSSKTPALQSHHDSVMESWNNLWSMSSLYVERLKSVELAISHYEESIQVVSSVEMKLVTYDDMPSDVNEALKVEQSLLSLKREMSHQQTIIDRMVENVSSVRHLVELSRPHQVVHADVSKLEEDTRKVRRRWDQASTQIHERLRAVETSVELLKSYKGKVEDQKAWVSQMSVKMESMKAVSKMDSQEMHREVESSMSLYTTVGHRKAAIEEVNVDGGRFIREAKIFDLHLKQYKEELEDVQPILDMSTVKTAKVLSGAELVSQELDTLNQQYSDLANALLQRLNELKSLVSNQEGQKFSVTIIQAAPIILKTFHTELVFERVPFSPTLTHYSGSSSSSSANTTPLAQFSHDTPHGISNHCDNTLHSKAQTSSHHNFTKNDDINRSSYTSIVNIDIDQPCNNPMTVEIAQRKQLSGSSMMVTEFERTRKLDVRHSPYICIADLKTIVDPSSNQKISWNTAVYKEVIKLNPVRYFHPHFKHGLTLSEAVSHDLIEEEFARTIILSCGIFDPTKNRELSLVEAIQNGMYDSHTASLKHARTDTPISVEEAVDSGLIAKEYLPNLFRQRIIRPHRFSFLDALRLHHLDSVSGQFTDPTSGVSFHLTEAYQLGFIDDGGQFFLRCGISFSNAIDKELIDPSTGLVMDPDSGESYLIGEAINNNILHVYYHEIVDTKTGRILSLDGALKEKIINENGYYFNSNVQKYYTFAEARHNKWIVAPLTLRDAYIMKLFDEEGNILNPITQKKSTILQAIDQGVFNIVDRCVLCPSTNEMLTILEALVRGVLTPDGNLIDLHSQEKLNITQSANRGLLASIHHLSVFEIEGFQSTVNKEFINFNAAVDNKVIDVRLGEIKLPSGEKISFEEAVKLQIMQPQIYDMMNRKVGIQSQESGQELSLIEAVSLGFVDPVKSCIQDPITKRPLNLFQAINNGIITEDGAVTLKSLFNITVTLTTVIKSTTRYVTVTSNGSGFDRKISFNDAFKQGLIDETDGTFKCLSTGTVVPIEEAIARGLLGLNVNLPEDPKKLNEVDIVNSSSDQNSYKKSTVESYSSNTMDFTNDVSELEKSFSYETQVNLSNTHVSQAKFEPVVRKTESDLTCETSNHSKEILCRGLTTGLSNDPVHNLEDPLEPISKSFDPVFFLVKSVDSGYVTYGEAEKRGLVDTHTNEYVDGITGKRLTLQEAKLCGLVIPFASLEFDAFTNNLQGILNTEQSVDSTAIQSTEMDFVSEPISVKLVNSSESTIIANSENELNHNNKEEDEVKEKESGSPVDVKPVNEIKVSKSAKAQYSTPRFEVTIGRAQTVQSPAKAVVLRKVRKKKMPLKDAAQRGLVDSDTVNTLEEVQTMKNNDGKPLSLEDAVRLKVIDGDCGAITDPCSKEVLTIGEALGEGILDSDSGQLILPIGRSLSIPEAVVQGLIEPCKQKIVHPEHGDHLTIEEAIVCDIIDPTSGVKKPITGESVTLEHAIDIGIVNSQTSEVKLSDKNCIGILEAVKMDIFESSPVEFNFPPLAMTFPVALSHGAIDLKSREYIHPVTTVHTPLSDALLSGLLMIIPPSQMVPNSCDTTDLWTALDSDLIDPISCTFKEPATSQIFSVADAVNSGILKITIHPDSITKSIDLSKMGVFCLQDFVQLTNDVDIYLTDKQENKFLLSTPAGQQLLVSNALVEVIGPDDAIVIAESINQIIANNPLNPEHSYHFDFFDEDRRSFFNPVTKDLISFSEIFSLGILNPSSFVIKDDQTNKFLSLEDAFSSHLIDENSGCYYYKSIPGQTSSCFEASKSGLILCIEKQTFIKVPKMITLKQAIHENYVDLDLSVLNFPPSSIVLPLNQALMLEIVNPNSVLVYNVKSNELVSMANATDTALISLEKNIYVHPITLKEMDLKTAFIKGIIIPKRKPMSLESAINHGLYDPIDGSFSDILMKQKINIEQAVQVSLIDKKLSLLKNTKSGGKFITLDEAINQRIVISRSGKLRDTESGSVFTFDVALQKGLIRTASLEVTFIAAIREEYYDSETGKFFNPISGNEESLQEAFQAKGFFNFLTTLIRPSESEEFILPEEALSQGILNGETGRILQESPHGEQWITLDEALNLGCIVSMKKPFTLKQALDMNLFDAETGLFLDPELGLHTNLLQALDNGLINKSSALINRQGNNSIKSLCAAVHSADFNKDSGKFFLDEQQGLVDLKVASDHHFIKLFDGSLNFSEVLDSKISFSEDCKTFQCTLQEAIAHKCIDDENAVVKDPSVKPFISLRKALAEKKIFLNKIVTFYIYPDGSKSSVVEYDGDMSIFLSEPKTFETAISDKSLDTSTGMYLCEHFKTRISLKNALLRGYIDPDSALVLDTKAQVLLPLIESFDAGILDSNNGTVIDTSSGRILTLKGALESNILLLSNHMFSIIEALKYGLYVPDTALFKNPFNSTNLNLGKAIEVGLLDSVSTIVRNPVNDLFLTVAEAIENGSLDPQSGHLTGPQPNKIINLLDAYKDGLLLPASRRIAIEEKYRLYVDNTGKLLSWLQEVEVQLAEIGLIREDADELHRQIGTAKTLNQDIVDHQRAVMLCIDQVQQLMEEGKDVLGREEIHYLQKNSDALKKRYAKASHESEKLLRRLNAAFEELRKFSNELATFMDWMKDAHVKQTEKERSLANLDDLKTNADAYKAFSSDAIAHQADLRFITMAAQKFIDESKDYLKVLNDFRTNLPHRLAHLEPGDSDVKAKVQEVTVAFQTLLRRIEELSDRFSMLTNRQRDFSENVEKAHIWLSNVEKTAKKLIEEPIAADPRAVQDQLDQVKVVSIEIVQQGRLIESVKHTSHSLLIVLEECGASASVKRHIEEIVVQLEEDYNRISNAINAKSNELQMALIHSQDIQDGLDRLIKWLDDAESMLRNQSRPISLIKEKLDEQIQEHKLLLSDIDGQKPTIDAINDSAQGLLDNSNTRLAKKIESKLKDVNTRFEKLCEKAQKRSDLFEDVCKSLGMFQALSGKFEDWLGAMFEVIRSREGEVIDLSTFDEVINQRDAKRDSYEEVIRSGKNLMSKRDVTDTNVIKEKVRHLEQLWKELSDLLTEKHRKTKEMAEQLSAYETLRNKVLEWLNNMEMRIEKLEPVGLDKEVLRRQSQEIKPLQKEHADYAPTIDRVNDLGNSYDAIFKGDIYHRRVGSPTRRSGISTTPTRISPPKLRRSPDFASPQAKSPYSSVSSGFGSSRSSAEALGGIEDLSPIQQQLSEINHRYMMLGTRLSDRSQEIGVLTDEIRVCFDSLKSLQAFVQAKERQLPGDPLPVSKDAATKQLQIFKTIQDEMHERQSEKDRLKAQTADLVKRKPDAHGIGSLQKQVADIDTRWKELQTLLRSRMSFLKDLESFQDAHDNMVNWLGQKEKMFQVLGPIASEPRMVTSQIQQLQVLRDEFTSQEPVLVRLRNSSQAVLDQIDVSSQGAKKVREQVQNVNSRWDDLMGKLSERERNLDAASGATKDFQDSLSRLQDRLQHIGDEFDNLSDAGSDAEDQLRKLTGLEEQLEDQRPLLADAEIVCNQLCNILSDSASKSEIKNKFNGVEKQYNNLNRKMNNRRAELESSMKEDRDFHYSFDRIQRWLNDMENTLARELPISANRDVLRRQITEFEVIYKEVLNKDHEIHMLMSRGTEMLPKITRKAEAAQLQNKMDNTKRQWDKVRKAAIDRHTHLQACSENCKKFHSALEYFVPWLNKSEDKFHALDPISLHRSQLDKQVKEIHAFKNDLSKHSQDYENTRNSGEVLITSCDVDTDIVKDDIDDLRKRWDRLNHDVLERSQALDDKSHKLNLYQDKARDVHHSLNRLEDRLHSHDALGDGSKDPKLLARMKSLLTESDSIWKLLDNLKDYATRLIAEASPSVDTSHITQEVEDLESRHKHLKGLLEDRCSDLESASEILADFNNKMKDAHHILDNLDEELDNMSPIARDISTIKHQINEIKDYMRRLKKARDDFDDVEHNCQSIITHGYTPDPKGCRNQLDSLHRQLIRLEERSKSRDSALAAMLTRLEKFYDDYKKISRELDDTGFEESSFKMIGGEIDTIRSQQDHFKMYRRDRLEPLGKHMDNINKTGQGLIQSAAPGVNTNILEQDLDALNDLWNSLKQKMNERERRLDAAFLQSGKFQEALDGVLKWLEDTEDMVANQKPPSADYKVVKAQLQEQKFLNKLLMDRQSNMMSLMAMGQDVMNNLEPIERNHVESQLNDLMHRFNELTHSAEDRTEALERTIPVAKAFQDKMTPLIEWLEQVEKKLGAMVTIPSDQDKIRQRIIQHEALHEDIMDHKEAFEELTEIAQTLMGLVGDDEAQTVVEKLQDVTNHYAKVVEDSEHLGHLLAEAYQGVGSFTVNYEDLMAWIEEMISRLSRFHTLSVYVEKLQEQLDELVELSEEIADHQKQVDDVASAGQDIMKHASGDDVIHMKEKLDNLGVKFTDLTSRAADRLRQAQESLPSVQNFHSSHKRVTLWMDSAERQLKSLESIGLTSQESIIQKLEREIQENRSLVDTLNHLGPQLCQMSPGEGAAVIESEVTKVNRRFDVICEQVQRKAERIDLSKQRNVEVIGDIEDLLDWFHEIEKQLRHAEPLTADPDSLSVLLKAQKVLNDEVSSQKGRVRDTLSAAKKLMRESSSGEDLAELRGKSDDLKDIANTVSSLCSERLAALEHALPLAEHFFETHADLCQWLDEMEAEADLLEAPALNAHHIKKQQERNKALMQSVNEHKALVDKLNKTGAALKKLCTIQEGAKVQDIVDSDNSRYNALKDILRDRQNALEEAMQATSQFSDKLDGMLNALSNTADQLNNAEPVSAHPEKIEEQLGDNTAVLKDLDKRSTALEAVKRAADDVIVKAGNARDPAVRDIKQKLDKLNDLWDNIQKLAHNRGRSLEDALAAAEKFWDELTMVMKTLNELQESLNAQEPPAVEPDAIQHQQDVLQEIRQEIEQTKPEVDQCRLAGQDLMQLCGEPDKPEVKKHIEDLDSAWENITTLYAKREQNLIDAMEKAMNFHDILQNLLEFLDYAEESFSALGPVGSDIEAVKGQILQLKGFKNEVDPHMVEIESLNRQAHELMERTSPAQARAIREPLSEINRRWDDLLKAMVDRQTELENALLRLGQFQHALDEFLVWISKTENTLDDLKPVFGDPQVIEVELAKHKVLTNDIQAHQTSVDTLNRAGRQLIEANRGSEDASVTQNKLHNLNKRWQHLQDKAEQRQNELEDALKEAQIFNQEIQDLLMWLSDIDSQLVSSKPVGGLPETAKEQLSRFMELYNDLDSNKHKVDSVLQQGQNYLKRSNEGAASNLQHNLRTLKQRWENVLNRANDRKIKLEIALREATEFHEALQDFVEWLTSAEKFLSSLKPVSRVMEMVLEQIDDHKAFQKEVASHREVMLNLDKKGTHLKYFSQKQDVILIKNLLISVQHRWERVVSKAAERTRGLDHGYKEAKEFHDVWSDLTNWLDEAEKGLNQVTHVGNDPEKIKQMLLKHKEFQRALGAKQPLYDGSMKLGRNLKEKCPKSDVPTLQGMMDDLKNKWNSVCSKSVDRQRKLEEALLFSGQFKDAVQALLDWLEKAKLALSENKLLHGDLDTVMALVDQHKSFQDDLKNRANNLESVRRTAKELLDSANPDDADHIRSQIQTLDTIWFEVAKLSDDKQRHLEEALREAERLHKAVHMLLEWLSDAEMKLRFSGPLPDDEETTKQQIEDHQRFMAEMAEQEIHKDATIAHAQEVLKKCHPDGISVIRHWITIIQSRWEEVSLWAKQREQRLNEHLRSLRDVLDLLEELLMWLIAAEASLMALEAEPLPDEIPVLEQLIIEHQGFMDDMTKRQPDVERVTKAFQSKRQPQQQSPTGKDKGRERHESAQDRKSGRGTPSIGKAPNRQPFEPDIKNPKARELVDKWRNVWLLAMERQRRLEDKLNYLKELERIKNFDFDEWRKKFLAWMNHKKSRVMDLFRKIDKDNDGKVTREDFIDGILKSKFPTSRLEMERVAEIFDRNGDGFVDHKEYIDTLRPDREKGPLTEAEKIQDEVQRQVAQCTCVHRFKVYQVGEGKYRFGESQKLRLVRILRSTVMVRVGGGWVALDEFLVKNDPCRAKGRTNLELREQFILAEGVSQSLQPFKPKASPQSSQSSQSGGSPFARPGMSLSSTGPITKIREKSERSVPMRQQKGFDSSSDFSNTSYSEADSSFGSRSTKMRTPNRLTPGSATHRSGGSRPSSRPSSRPPSRATSDLTSEQVDGYRSRQNAASGARQRTPSASSSSSSLRQPTPSSGTRIPAIRRTPSFGSSKATPEKRERERWK